MRGAGSPATVPDCSLTAQTDEGRRIAADHHHLVTQGLDHASVGGQALADRIDEALHRADRLLVAALDRQARVASEIRERDRDPQAAVLPSAVAEIGLDVADQVLLDEVAQQPVVDVAQERHHEGISSRTMPSISSPISALGTPARIRGSWT